MDEMRALKLNINGDKERTHQLIISDLDVQYCFALSKMTVVDDNLQEKSYFKLKFVEFFEFLTRVSYMARILEHNTEDDKPKTAKRPTSQESEMPSSPILERKPTPLYIRQLENEQANEDCF